MNTFARISATTGEPVATLDITTLQQELSQRYSLDLAGAFPQAPIVEEWPVDLVQAIIESARAHIAQDMTQGTNFTPINKAIDDLTAEEEKARLATAHQDTSGPDGRFWTSFQMPTITVDPVYAAMQAKLDETAQFVQNGAAAHDLLRNLGIEDQLAQETQEQQAAQVGQ